MKQLKHCPGRLLGVTQSRPRPSRRERIGKFCEPSLWPHSEWVGRSARLWSALLSPLLLRRGPDARGRISSASWLSLADTLGWGWSHRSVGGLAVPTALRLLVLPPLWVAGSDAGRILPPEVAGSDGKCCEPGL